MERKERREKKVSSCLQRINFLVLFDSDSCLLFSLSPSGQETLLSQLWPGAPSRIQLLAAASSSNGHCLTDHHSSDLSASWQRSRESSVHQELQHHSCPGRDSTGELWCLHRALETIQLHFWTRTDSESSGTGGSQVHPQEMPASSHSQPTGWHLPLHSNGAKRSFIPLPDALSEQTVLGYFSGSGKNDECSEHDLDPGLLRPPMSSLSHFLTLDGYNFLLKYSETFGDWSKVKSSLSHPT